MLVTSAPAPPPHGGGAETTPKPHRLASRAQDVWGRRALPCRGPTRLSVTSEKSPTSFQPSAPSPGPRSGGGVPAQSRAPIKGAQRMEAPSEPGRDSVPPSVPVPAQRDPSLSRSAGSPALAAGRPLRLICSRTKQETQRGFKASGTRISIHRVAHCRGIRITNAPSVRPT